MCVMYDLQVVGRNEQTLFYFLMCTPGAVGGNEHINSQQANFILTIERSLPSMYTPQAVGGNEPLKTDDDSCMSPALLSAIEVLLLLLLSLSQLWSCTKMLTTKRVMCMTCAQPTGSWDGTSELYSTLLCARHRQLEGMRHISLTCGFSILIAVTCQWGN